MRLQKVRIENYRCLEDVTVELDDLTVFVGANGSGKSSVLRGLKWFFDGGPLEPGDVFRHSDETVRVTVTFADLTMADREALGSYATGKTLTLWRTCSAAEGRDKLTGRGLAYPPFEEVRAEQGARATRTAYMALREDHPELGLSAARTGDASLEAMKQWEETHPDKLAPSTFSASHLFGAVGQPKLNGRFDYVFVAAVHDASEEVADGRGTLLSRLLERMPSDEERLSERLEEVVREATERVEQLLGEEHDGALRAVNDLITDSLSRYVRGVEVSLESHPPAVRVSPPSFDMRVIDDGLPTDVARQGHGLQRALLLAMLQALARSGDEAGDVPSVFLAIEEPELYQHPVQARHFASVLQVLPRTGEGAFQVAYATHSSFFVDPRRFERLRRFSRGGDGARRVSVATADRVAERLAGIVPKAEIALRIQMTLERTLAEAVFADTALLVEGRSDQGLFEGLADRDGGFASYGVAVVRVDGKPKLSIARAILDELGIPSFVVFDGDAQIADEMRRRKPDVSQQELASQTANVARINRGLLRLLGADEVDFPEDAVRASYAVFRGKVEEAWPEAVARAKSLGRESGDWREKSEDHYREAAQLPEIAAPASFAEIIENVRALVASPVHSAGTISPH